ncbi:MAG: hypothetical protein APF78_06265 [Sphingomonadales bacterium BRH_c3]|nr:MAG: hypothetical protein APF78_06265 [Sphingomonadales bacterium BRH_c3]
MGDLESLENGQTAAAPRPATSNERIASLDFIRGIAVMGILAANIVAFGQPFGAYMYPAGFLTEHGVTSDWLWAAQFVLVDGKMRGLFTLLFGAGMMLFMERAWARGATRWLQARRLFWLGVFGLVHFFFIWRGDILFYYAVIGLAVLLMVGWQAQTQLKVGIWGYLAGAFLYAVMMAPLPLVADTELGEQANFSEMRAELEVAKQEALADDVIETEIVQSGDYAGYVVHRFKEHGSEPLSNIALFFMETLPLMLIGMALYRMGLFSGEFDPGKQRRWGWTGVMVGGALHLIIALWAMAGGLTYYGTLAAFVGISPVPRLVMVLGLAALLSLYAPHATGWLGQRISAAGRAAFSNYLGTSIVMLFVFHGWALGLFGRLDRPQLYLVVAVTWVLMLLWSKPWLDRFRYGPLEWLWRCLTYGRIFAMRR